MTKPSTEVLLDQIAALTSIARTTWLGLLAGCAYVWVARASLTDGQILSNSRSLVLPILGTEIEALGFLVAAPLILLLLTIYLHVVIIRLWWLYAQLPLRVDELPMSERVTPWIVAALLPSVGGPRLFGMLARLAAIAFVWVLPLATIAVAGGSYVVASLVLTIYQSVILVIATTVMVLSLLYVRRPFQETRSKPFYPRLENIWFCMVAGLAGLLLTEFGGFPRQFHVNYLANSRIDLVGAEISKPKEGWTSYPIALAQFQAETCDKAEVFDCNETVFAQTKTPKAALLDRRVREATPISTIPLTGQNLSHGNHDSLFAVKGLLADTDFSGSSLINADLEQADLTGATLTEANLLNASLVKIKAEGSVFDRASLQNTYLTDADLDDAWFMGANLTSAELWRASLRSTTFDAAILDQADLSSSTLIFSTFSGASLRNANLRNTRAFRTSYDGADLTGTDFIGAFFTSVTGDLRPAFANFSNALMLHTRFKPGQTERPELILWNTLFIGTHNNDMERDEDGLRDNNLFRLEAEGTSDYLLPWSFRDPAFTGLLNMALAWKTEGAAFRFMDLGSASNVSLKATFGDATTDLPFDPPWSKTDRIDRPACWSAKRLNDLEFFGQWRGVVEALGQQWPPSPHIGALELARTSRIELDASTTQFLDLPTIPAADVPVIPPSASCRAALIEAPR